jgi:hypothetical protein
MQIPILLHLFDSYKKEKFTLNNEKIPLSVLIYYLIIVYLSTLVSVYATVLCWDSTKGTLFKRLTYATVANMLGVFYLIYHYLTTN